MPECDTRTYVEDNKYLRWNAGDEITIFNGNSYNSHWKFAGEDGANSGKFTEVEENGFVTGTPLNLTANYAIYPYNENITITEAGVVALTLPAVQEYNHIYANSFGAGANTMMAVTENTSDNFLSFKNLCGYLKLKFYGDDVTVKSVTIKGNNGEKIAGKATVSMAYGSEPTITMGDDATDTITIDCGEGVTLNNDSTNPTIFWVVIPETTFEGGITITVTDTNDQTFTKTTTNAVPIVNNMIQPMAALEVECKAIVPETWKIYYTATAQVFEESWVKDTFGANIVSNEWNENSGEGVITFDEEVTKIGAEAFYYCSKLTSIIIPDNAVSIDDYAFSNCSNLTNITIPNSVASIEQNAFAYCSNLVSITIPDGVSYIAWRSFYNCYRLFNITIPDSVTLIDGYAFYGCSSLINISIPDGVTSIGQCAFMKCSSLINISIPNGVTSIESSTFSNCSSLTSITIPNGVTSIGNTAFSKCTSLTNITIPDSVTSIGWSAFSGCEKISSITIPEGVTSIEEGTFEECSNLTSVIIGNGVKTIDYQAFFCCSSLSSITIPDGVTRIGYMAFANCTSLTSAIIGNGLETIEYSAFYGCSNLTSVIIGSGVTIIGHSAFMYCPKLIIVCCNAIAPPSGGNNMFYSNASERKIYVPEASVGLYKTANIWSSYADCIIGF